MSDGLHDELKQLIVEAVMLEDVAPEDIDVDEPLFGAGLGLDSIDVLELSMALEKRYRVKFKANDEQNAAIFVSVRTLASHISSHRPA